MTALHRMQMLEGGRAASHICSQALSGYITPRVTEQNGSPHPPTPPIKPVNITHSKRVPLRKIHIKVIEKDMTNNGGRKWCVSPPGVSCGCVHRQNSRIKERITNDGTVTGHKVHSEMGENQRFIWRETFPSGDFVLRRLVSRKIFNSKQIESSLFTQLLTQNGISVFWSGFILRD